MTAEDLSLYGLSFTSLETFAVAHLLSGVPLFVAYTVGTMALWRIALSYLSSIALVFALHIGPIRRLYRAGKL